MFALPQRLAALFVLSTAPAAAFGIPIDCSKASTSNERTICADPFLLQADARLDTLYDVSSRMVAMGTRGDLIDSQRAWIREREACGADKNCIRAAYAKRSAVFEEILQRVEAHGPF